jgi:hypothetical protein
VVIEFLRDHLLEHLQGYGQVASLRFAQEQVHVFGHDDKSCYIEPVPAAYSFQHDNECVSRLCAFQQWSAAMTTERNEMNVTRLLVSL